MNANALTRLAVDFAMTALMVALMAYQVVGGVAHEILGTLVGVLFIVHAVLNRHWFAHFFSGRATPMRVLQNFVILLVLLDAVTIMVTGVMISGTVFAFLDITRGVGVARSLHLAASYWGMVLMSVHIGLHWSMVMGMTRAVFGVKGHRGAAAWLSRLTAAALAVCGARAFGRVDAWGFLTLRSQFAFFDETQSDLAVLFGYFSIMALFIFLSHYAGKGLQAFPTSRKDAAR
ncbi:MAG: DUF4405 domain-containing protein [Pyramidobacter sp.]|nr:DUF4405 domain-containing protein [Pyramidobacter sp.]